VRAAASLDQALIAPYIASYNRRRRPRMKFGLFGGARARGGPAGDSHAYHDFVNYVIEAEKLGFTSVFLVEHFNGFGQVSASMSLLAYLAART